MENKKNDPETLPEIIRSAGRFRYEAMATVFEIYIIHEDHKYAGQAAREAFEAINRLEGILSRYIENSDISRINRLKTGEVIPVGLDTIECLCIAAEMNEETFGAFDITIGNLFECWLSKDKTLKTPSKEELAEARKRTGMHLLEIDEDDFTVKALEDNVSVDLGAIGKGFAIDKAAEILKEWSLDTAFIHSGGSTILAAKKPSGTDGWPVTMSLPDWLWKKNAKAENKIEVLKKVYLHDTALSGSNLEQGSHVIDPRLARPVERNFAAWSKTSSTAKADALSTALLAMTDDEAAKYFKKNPSHSGIAVTRQPNSTYEIHNYGQWA